MFRRILVALILALAFATPALAQSIPTVTFSGLPGSPTGGQLSFISDSSTTPTVGSPAAGGGSNKDLVAYDSTQTRWEFVSRIPTSGATTALQSYMDAIRVAYDNATSGAIGSNIQAVIDELFANQTTTESRFFVWPTFESIGGLGRPSQLIVIDSLAFSTKLSGSGRDDDGDTWGGGCGASSREASDATDQPCTNSTASIAGLSISLNGSYPAFSNTINWDVETDAQASLFCRDSTTYLHEIGTAGDTSIAADGDYVATVLKDATGEVYRIASVYMPSVNCVARTGDLGTGGQISYPTTTTDDLMPFIMDGVHLSPYGSRWTAQEVLTATWEDLFPEPLGLTNLVSNGYMETTCTDGSPLTKANGGDTGNGGAFAARAGSEVTPLNRPIVGQGCEWQDTGDTDIRTATTAVVSAEPGAYYVGSVSLASGGAAANRSAILRIRTNAGANVTNARFWVAGQPTGIGAELASTIDASGTGTPGEYQMTEPMLYGGAIIKFAFQVPAGATGFDIQFAQTNVTTQYPLYLDELWVRKKVHQDLERHYIIADGKARIQLFTDSRGLVTRYESLQQSFDYMLGETTTSGNVRALGSIRPNLHLVSPVTDNTYTVSGQRLGNYVGENDGFENYGGTAATEPRLSTLIDGTTNYCLAYYGINDLTIGARPTSAAIQGDSAANRHLYWLDQIRGFEIEAEKMGCVPIAIMEPVVRGDTSTTSCSNAAGSPVNCATWHREAWKNYLHNRLQ